MWCPKSHSLKAPILIFYTELDKCHLMIRKNKFSIREYCIYASRLNKHIFPRQIKTWQGKTL